MLRQFMGLNGLLGLTLEISGCEVVRSHQLAVDVYIHLGTEACNVAPATRQDDLWNMIHSATWYTAASTKEII